MARRSDPELNRRPMSRANREAAMKVNRADPDLSTGAKYLLVCIGDLVADGRKLETGCDYLAAELGEHRATVQRWRSELVDAGYLIPDRVVKGGQRSNTYDLDLTPAESDNRSSLSGDNRPPLSGTTAHPRAVTEDPTAHQPLTNRSSVSAVTAHQPLRDEREQEQEVTGTGSATDDSEFEAWVLARTAQRGGGPGLAAKIRREDRAIYEAERAANTAESRTDPSPDRNDPATCKHLAVDEHGACAACMTEPARCYGCDRLDHIKDRPRVPIGDVRYCGACRVEAHRGDKVLEPVVEWSDSPEAPDPIDESMANLALVAGFDVEECRDCCGSCGFVDHTTDCPRREKETVNA